MLIDPVSVYIFIYLRIMFALKFSSGKSITGIQYRVIVFVCLLF